MYRGEVEIPPLSMVDDLLSLSECFFKTSMAHAYLTFKLTVRDYNLDHKFTFTCFPFIQHCTICFLPGNQFFFIHTDFLIQTIDGVPVAFTPMQSKFILISFLPPQFLNHLLEIFFQLGPLHQHLFCLCLLLQTCQASPPGLLDSSGWSRQQGGDTMSMCAVVQGSYKSRDVE